MLPDCSEEFHAFSFHRRLGSLLRGRFESRCASEVGNVADMALCAGVTAMIAATLRLGQAEA